MVRTREELGGEREEDQGLDRHLGAPATMEDEDSPAAAAGQERGERNGRRRLVGDFLALRRLYGLLQQNSSGADGGGCENGEMLDKRSVMLLKKLLDDATQQAIQSQAKLLINTNRSSTSTPASLLPTHPFETRPSLEARNPEPECPEEPKACHHCPTQTQRNTSPMVGEDRFEKKITEFELGKAPPKKQNSMKSLGKEIFDVVGQCQRWSDGRRPAGEDFTGKAKREMSRESLGYKEALTGCGRLSRGRSMASASHPLGESRRCGRRANDVTPKQGHHSGTNSTRGQAGGESRGTACRRDRLMEWTKSKEKELLESNLVGKIGFLDGGRKKQGHRSHRGDEATRRRRTPIQPKPRMKNRSSSRNRGKRHVVSRNPTHLRRNPRRSSRDVPPEWASSSSPTNPSSSRSPTTGLTSSSSTSSHDSNRQTPCRRAVVVRPRPTRTTTSPVPIARRRSFGSRRVPIRSTSLRRQPPLPPPPPPPSVRPKHKQLMDTTPLEEDGKHCNAKLKKEGRLRRMKNKLSIIFHHHHHHYHHHEHEHEDEHRSRWKRKRFHHEGEKEELESVGERAAARAPHLDQHGYLHTLLGGLLRHLWHSKAKKKKKKAPVGKRTSDGGWLRRKKMHWWRRWRKGGGVRLCGGKKKKAAAAAARLRIGFGRTTTTTTKKKRR